MAVEIYTYRYIPKNVELSLDTNYSFLDGTVTYLYISHDYLNRRMPVIQIGIEMQGSMIEKLYQNIDKAKLKLDINEVQYNGDEEVINTQLYLRHTFNVIPMRDKTVYLTNDNFKSDTTIDIMKTVQMVELYLIDITYVQWFTRQISGIMSKCSYQNALQTLFIQRNIPNGIVIATPPEQNGTINKLSLPLDDLIGNIELLNDNYGLYKTSPIIFYDYEHLYCLNPKEPNITLKSVIDYGTVTFLLENPDSPYVHITGSCDDLQTQTHYINLNKEPSINEVTTWDTDAKFSTVTSVDNKGAVDKRTIDENATALRYIYQQNGFTIDQVQNTLTGHWLNLIASNIRVGFLKPYKTYNFMVGSMYQNLNLTGHDYRISKWTIAIEREASNQYIHTANIELYKPYRNK